MTVLSNEIAQIQTRLLLMDYLKNGNAQLFMSLKINNKGENVDGI